MTGHLIGDSHQSAPERRTGTCSSREVPFSRLVEDQPGQRIGIPCDVGNAAVILKLTLYRRWQSLLVGGSWEKGTKPSFAHFPCSLLKSGSRTDYTGTTHTRHP